MSAASVATTRSGRTLKIGLILIIIAVAGALSAVDIFLEQAQEAELASQARAAYETGMRLLQAGNANEAVEAFRKAHVLERSNVNYELQLVAALTAAGKTSEAEPLANEVLDADRNDGAANLVVARLRLKEGKIDDAKAYYHRAIYGGWPQDAAAHRIAARLELIDLLVKLNQKQELLAELLPLEERAARNPAIQARVARLFLTAGSPSRAAEVYRELIHEQPANADWYAGLGEAELELGDYREAHVEFAAAPARKPGDAEIKAKLQLASTLAGLDPTPRWLPSAEKYQRSLRILGAAQQDLERCVQSRPAAAVDGEQKLLNQAEEMIEQPTPVHVNNELSERALSLAQEIWGLRLSLCGPATASDEEALRLIMAKLNQ